MTVAEQLREEGREEGQREMLGKLLKLRFGKIPRKAATRIKEARSEALSRWAERVLTATSVDEVFSE